MTAKKNPFFWKALNSISNGRKPISREEFEANEKEYQPFMIMKWLSQDLSLGPALKHVSNREARNAPKYTHYLGLFYLMMPHKQYRNFFRDFGFAKKGSEKYNKEEIEATMEYWNTGPEEAVAILDDITDEQRADLLSYCKRVGIHV